MCARVCACVCVCEPPAQPPGLAAKPLPDQCWGPGWPSNSLSLMKNKPLKHRDCLQTRGKGTISGTLHPPQGTQPQKGATKAALGGLEFSQPEYPSVPVPWVSWVHGKGLLQAQHKEAPTEETTSRSAMAPSPCAGLTLSTARGPLPQAPHSPAPMGHVEGWMPSGRGRCELLKMSPLRHEGFMWCSARSMWGAPHYCRVQDRPRGWSLLWSCLETSPSHVPVPSPARGKGSEDSGVRCMSISPCLSDGLPASQLTEDLLSSQLRAPGAGRGVSGHGDTCQEAGWELGDNGRGYQGTASLLGCRNTSSLGNSEMQVSSLPSMCAIPSKAMRGRGPSSAHLALGAAAAVSSIPKRRIIPGSFKLCAKLAVFQPAFPQPGSPRG